MNTGDLGDFGEIDKSAILEIFCQFRQISLSIGIDTTWVNIGHFGEFGELDKIGNFGDIWKVLVSARFSD